MEIKIGETLFIGGDSDYKLSPPVQGLESPAYRVGDGIYAGRDGGYVSGHFYGHRTITIKGFYIGTNCENAAELRKVLFSYLRIRYRLPILITTSEGQYYTEGFVTDVKADVENLVSGEYQITLLCPDPILYEAENNEVIWVEETLTDGSSTPISNDGEVEIYPIITITGVVNNLELINEATEQTMQINITTENADDEIIVDMNSRIITLNGSAINEYRTLNSSWWCLNQETNDIVFDSNGSATATIKFRKGISGI